MKLYMQKVAEHAGPERAWWLNVNNKNNKNYIHEFMVDITYKNENEKTTLSVSCSNKAIRQYIPLAMCFSHQRSVTRENVAPTRPSASCCGGRLATCPMTSVTPTTTRMAPRTDTAASTGSTRSSRSVPRSEYIHEHVRACAVYVAGILGQA